jgi:hypothetical protein
MQTNVLKENCKKEAREIFLKTKPDKQGKRLKPQNK